MFHFNFASFALYFFCVCQWGSYVCIDTNWERIERCVRSTGASLATHIQYNETIFRILSTNTTTTTSIYSPPSLIRFVNRFAFSRTVHSSTSNLMKIGTPLFSNFFYSFLFWTVESDSEARKAYDVMTEAKIDTCILPKI